MRCRYDVGVHIGQAQLGLHSFREGAHAKEAGILIATVQEKSGIPQNGSITCWVNHVAYLAQEHLNPSDFPGAAGPELWFAFLRLWKSSWSRKSPFT